MKIKLNDYDVSQADHFLKCTHAMPGKNQPPYKYKMKCIVLGKTKSGKLKIIVFGYRYWLGRDFKKRISYVSSRRVLKMGT